MIKNYLVRYADDTLLTIVASTDEEAKFNAQYAHQSVVMSIEEINPLFAEENEPQKAEVTLF